VCTYLLIIRGKIWWVCQSQHVVSQPSKKYRPRKDDTQELNDRRGFRRGRELLRLKRMAGKKKSK
jgi:hypothetical protein